MISLIGKQLSCHKWLVVAVLACLLVTIAFSTVDAQKEEPANKQRRDQLFRIESRPVAGGAELITISAQLRGPSNSNAGSDSSTPEQGDTSSIPLVAVLRDTLGDSNAENDRLRYLWDLTYTRPSSKQRLASAIPFLYARIVNNNHLSKEPPPLIDLAAADSDVWQKVFSFTLQNALMDPYSLPLRAASRSYQRNIGDYRKSHVYRALSVIALYQTFKAEQLFSDTELQEIQARLMLTDKTFGGIVADENLRRHYEKETARTSDIRGHNWELLRQQAEADGLYFEPLQMPDGAATHALLWIAQIDLESQRKERFDGRFLNIKNPWTDKRLLNWRGYSETRYFNEDNRQLSPSTLDARATKMIPLALYGLDSPKIPLLLVDFRDTLNPKMREMSGRAFQDVTKNLLDVSGGLPYLLGHRLFNFVTRKRGIDIDQPSRLREYAQLKLLLSLDNSLAPALENETSRLLEKLSLNPSENDLETETRLAQEQYEALLAYAARPDGLPAQLERDRRSEMTKLIHSRKAQFGFKLANVITFGLYTHRESVRPDMAARVDLARSLAYHTRFLREVSRSSPQIEVSWNLLKVKEALQFITEHGAEANAEAALAVAAVFERTQDDATRRICLDSLSRINNKRARTVLAGISQNMKIDHTWRQLSVQYLERSARAEAMSELFLHYQ